MVKFTKGDCRGNGGGNGAGDVEKNKWSSSQRGIAGEMGQEMCLKEVMAGQNSLVLYLANWQGYNKPEDQLSCKRSPDILAQ